MSNERDNGKKKNEKKKKEKKKKKKKKNISPLLNRHSSRTLGSLEKMTYVRNGSIAL